MAGEGPGGDTAFMGLLRLRLGAEGRDPARWVGVILLLALAGGAALTAAQAARRTDTAFSRDLVEARASDAVVIANVTAQNEKQTRVLRASGVRLLDAVDRSSLVIAHGRFGGAKIFRIHDGKLDERLITGSAFGLVAYDDRIGRAISTLRVYAGRPARPDRADEITISPATATITGWRVGTRVTDLREYDGKDLDPNGAPRLDRGTHLSLRVTGVAELPENLLQPGSQRVPRLILTPAFARRFPDAVFYFDEWIRLRHRGADLPALRVAVSEANRAAPEVGIQIAPTTESLVKVNRANDPLVKGLWILAALFALVGILLAAQSLGRSLSARADDHAQFRAMGATRRQRFSIDLATLAAVAAAAAVLAVILGCLFSPLTPVGAARDAEPHSGFSLDLALVSAAFGVIFVGTVLAALPALLRVVNTNALPGTGPNAVDPGPRRSRVADLVARAGLGAPAVVGTRLALQPGRGATATPIRSVLASLALVVATVTGTFAFGVNLQRWTTTPRLYGWNWDAAVGSSFGTIPPQFEQEVAHFPHVVEASALNLGLVTIAGRAIPAIGINAVRGTVAPQVDAGRLPTNVREIMLGARTMRALHVHIGDTVAATVGTAHARLSVVGRTTFPALGNERENESGLGTGALGTASRFPVVDPTTPGGRYNYILLRFAPGTAQGAEQQLREFLAKNGCSDPTCVVSDGRPTDIDGYRSARRLPLAIGVVLVLLLVATLTHVLGSTMRRRSGDLAILRALGCSPRSLVATMCWQSLALTSTAILIGIPCGLLANRIAWQAFTTQLGIAPGIVTPIATVAIGAVALLAVAMIVATAVGLRAPRMSRRYRFAS